MHSSRTRPPSSSAAAAAAQATSSNAVPLARKRRPSNSAPDLASATNAANPVAHLSSSHPPNAPKRLRFDRTAPAMSSDGGGSWRTGGPPSAPGTASTWGRGVAQSAGLHGRAGGKGPSRGAGGSSANGAGGGSNHASKKSKAKGNGSASGQALALLPGPMHSLQYLTSEFDHIIRSGRLKKVWLENPKSPLQNLLLNKHGQKMNFHIEVGYVEGRRDKIHRATIVADPTRNIIAYGDAPTAKEAEKVAASHAMLLLAEANLLDPRPEPGSATAVAAAAAAAATAAKPSAQATVQLSDGSTVTAERAREFFEYYCRMFKFGKPDVVLHHTDAQRGRGRGSTAGLWHAEYIVNASCLGVASGQNKKTATTSACLDAVRYLEQCDPNLWSSFNKNFKPGAPLTAAPHVLFRITEDLDADILDILHEMRASRLFAKRPRLAGQPSFGEKSMPDILDAVMKNKSRSRRFAYQAAASEDQIKAKSERLMTELDAYQTDERVAAIRKQRQSLPVQQKAADVLVKIELSQVTIVMAATGSGKTTQIPQILFDDYILRGEGARCNIWCTQPRRIAAISVAERVARERGERPGRTVGYQVRFEHKLPEENGSITFCTTGIFLRRLQSALSEESASNSFLDSLTHIVVDEVHERDIETDLLLVVIKRLLEERRQKGKREIKLILMSATIDPTLFQNYFARAGRPAPVVEVPGRSFPVTKRFLEETIMGLRSLQLPYRQGGFVWDEKNVRDYLHREIDQHGGAIRRVGDTTGAASVSGRAEEAVEVVDDLEIPYALVALMVAHVISQSSDGHVLVFLPGWDEIKAVHKVLAENPLLGYNFNDTNRFEVHILHSTVPVAEQQAVFDPPRDPSIRRIILSTNIAETSVTIPDVVYVVDTGRVKEKRYDPERHLSSLVSAWVGTSNLNQRAGRAGRHRSGEYFGILSMARYNRLNVNQTVEMMRADLSNVVMHIKALDIPGMEVEDVLAAAIEPPPPERVRAAMDNLQWVGALDKRKQLTSLGHVLLQLPVDVAIGKMCLYGAFFRAVEPTITLAAILTNRDPFVSPLHLKQESNAVKDSWCPTDFRSDALAVLRAYTVWAQMQSRGDYVQANRFCSDNFLAKPTLLQIMQVREHLFMSMERAGVLDVVVGADARRGDAGFRRFRNYWTPSSPELNYNSECTPLLAGLIALASTPNFSIRASEKVFRTSQDKACFIHPSSVCHPKHTKDKPEASYNGEKELFAFAEKMRNVSMVTSNGKGGGGGGGGQTTLRGVTRLDPLTYMLFGANTVRVVNEGILCDDWLPIRGDYEALDDAERLKAILDACMLRVFEGIGKTPPPPPMGNSQGARSRGWADAGDEGEDQDEDEGQETTATTMTTGANGHGGVQRNGSGGGGGGGGNNKAPTQAEDLRADLSLSQQEKEEFQRLTSGVVLVLQKYAESRGMATSSSSRGSTRPATPQSMGVGMGMSMGMGMATGGHRGGASAAAAGLSRFAPGGSSGGASQQNSRPASPGGWGAPPGGAAAPPMGPSGRGGTYGGGAAPAYAQAYGNAGAGAGGGGAAPPTAGRAFKAPSTTVTPTTWD